MIFKILKKNFIQNFNGNKEISNNNRIYKNKINK